MNMAATHVHIHSRLKRKITTEKFGSLPVLMVALSSNNIKDLTRSYLKLTFDGIRFWNGIAPSLWIFASSSMLLMGVPQVK